MERKTRIISNTQDHDNERGKEDIANVCEADNANGVSLDTIHESLFSPNDFQNNDVFVIGVDNEDEVEGSRSSNLELHGLIGEMNGLVFISDQNPSIAKAAARVFPNSLHVVQKLFGVVEFNQIMAQIRGTDERVAQYLIEADPRKLARNHFDGRRHCIMTTNIAECLNGILKDEQ
ncbi:hypothetical protein Dsin_000924 [Dipteronia sinensis]|uniref:Uncharacterized protein n=1 Tax=Dipteronia sinensis TaxID=43782 RepID=A0AAE0EHV9_9ROSI|nr:hypothetical protein Dsin_000924 [Dipteronia sinensis]